MRKLLALLFAVAAGGPLCTANPWQAVVPGTTTQTTAVSSPVTATSTVNTTSPYSGFTATGTSTPYTGALTTVGGTSYGGWGTPSQTTTAIVSNTTASGAASWPPQSTQQTTASVSSFGGWASPWAAVGPLSQQSSYTPPPAPGAYGSYPISSADNPEPGTLLTFMGGIGGLLLWRRRVLRNNQK